MKAKIILIIGLLILSLNNIFVNDVFAASGDSEAGLFAGCASKNDLRTGDVNLNTLACFGASVIRFLIGISGTIAVIFIIIGGYQIIYAGFIGGDSSKGKNTLTKAIIGFVIAAFSYLIVTYIMKVITSVSMVSN